MFINLLLIKLKFLTKEDFLIISNILKHECILVNQDKIIIYLKRDDTPLVQKLEIVKGDYVLLFGNVFVEVMWIKAFKENFRRVKPKKKDDTSADGIPDELLNNPMFYEFWHEGRIKRDLDDVAESKNDDGLYDIKFKTGESNAE